MNPIWGIDLGGTKIEGVILESVTSIKVVERMRIPTEAKKGYEHILKQIERLVEELKSRSGLFPEKIGMGTPGTLEPSSQTMKNCNATILNGKFLKRDLEIKFGFPFNLANDANCFAIAEAKFGGAAAIAPKAECIFGIIMGTGVGGGIVVNGKVLNGSQGIGGEWGHNFLDDSGGMCYCGRVGCVETIIAGPSLEKYYTNISGNNRPLREIDMRGKKKNDIHAEQTINRLNHFFGKAVANVINIIDPEVVVLGGGVGNIDSLYSEGVEEAKKYVFNHTLETKFIKPTLGDSAGVFGAALL
jgi:predicted NBD/HSP70 family sugar kinase